MAAALERLAAVRPREYADTRSHLRGAVTGLSPYLTHGFLSVPQVITALRKVHRIGPRHKLIFELAWREYFRRAWRTEAEGIFESLHPGPLPDEAYASELPADVIEARTGLAVIDRAVRTLYSTGYLHNHARMWLASYLVHLRKVHWRTGADWLYGHLLDGDLASNHLSWQWVAGTGSHKPYLFNAENVLRYAPGDWQISGTALDLGYETLEAMACRADARLPAGDIDTSCGDGVVPPTLRNHPPGALVSPADAAQVAGRDVWLVHPWCLADPPADVLPVAVFDAHFHARWPWSERRWGFVGRRTRALASIRWFDAPDALASALSSARSVSGVSDSHLGATYKPFALDKEPRAFDSPEGPFRSFSAWWMKAELRGRAMGDSSACTSTAALTTPQTSH